MHDKWVREGLRAAKVIIIFHASGGFLYRKVEYGFVFPFLTGSLVSLGLRLLVVVRPLLGILCHEAYVLGLAFSVMKRMDSGPYRRGYHIVVGKHRAILYSVRGCMK